MTKSAFYLRLKYDRLHNLQDREMVEEKKDEESNFSL